MSERLLDDFLKWGLANAGSREAARMARASRARVPVGDGRQGAGGDAGVNRRTRGNYDATRGTAGADGALPFAEQLTDHLD